jgi:hypothetical protein
MPILDNLEAYIEHKLNMDLYEDYDLELAIQNPRKDQDKAV